MTRLKARLLELGYSPQYLVAAKAGIHPSTLSQYCRGQKAIAVHHLQRLAVVLDCPAEALLGTVAEGEAARG